MSSGKNAVVWATHEMNLVGKLERLYDDNTQALCEERPTTAIDIEEANISRPFSCILFTFSAAGYEYPFIVTFGLGYGF